MEEKGHEVKRERLKLESGVVKFYGEGFKEAQKAASQVKLSYHSAGYHCRDENSNTSNYEYQFSEMDESEPFQGPVNVNLARGEERAPRRGVP